MGHLRELLAGSGLPDERRKELGALAGAYAEAFDALVVSIGARNAKIAELDGGAVSLEPLVAKLREEVKNSESRLRREWARIPGAPNPRTFGFDKKGENDADLANDSLGAG
jgi:hypothetical protein